MRSVTHLSVDVRRAMRAATAASGASAVLFVIAVLGAQYAYGHIVPILDTTSIYVLATCLAGILATALALDIIRDRILLRTGLWFGHAYAHHHLVRRATQGASRAQIAIDEQAFRVVQSALIGGFAAYRAAALWLPIYCLGLAAIDPLQSVISVVGLCALGLMARVATRLARDHTDRISVHVLCDNPTVATTDIDRWEQRNRVATFATYRHGLRVARYRVAMGVMTASCLVILSAEMVWRLQTDVLTLMDVLCCAGLQVRCWMVAWTYAKAWPIRRDIEHWAVELARPTASNDAPNQNLPRLRRAPGQQLSTSQSLRHAA
jgi:hypothetical protein